MSIPIVIFHTGGQQEYFKRCVSISSQKNTVYIIGDNSNKELFSNNENVQFFHVDDLHSNEIDTFKSCFVNYSSNSHDYEITCYLRVFYLKKLFEKTGKQWMFHTDSDCILLENVNDIFPEPTNIAYSIQKMENKFHMVGSIHNSLLDIDFCNKFIELCFDIYLNRSKFDLIDKKLQWHKITNTPGGICDMTLYYLLYSENIIANIIDLNMPMKYPGTDIDIIFDHNVCDSYGFNGERTFNKNIIKIIRKIENRFYFQLADKQQQYIQTMSIHFQGNAKRLLSSFSLNR
jgi:hypothetical protein